MSTPDDEIDEVHAPADQEADGGADQEAEEAGALPAEQAGAAEMEPAFVQDVAGAREDDVQAPEPGEAGPVAFDVAPLKQAWERTRTAYERHLKKIGRKPAGLSRYVRGATSFIDWAASRGYGPGSATEAWKKDFTAYIESLGGAPINKNVDRLAGLGMIDMALNPNPDDQQYDDEPEEQEEDGQEEEAAPAPRKKQAQQQVVFVQAAPPKFPRAPKTPGPAPRNVMGKLLNTEKVRVYKRNFGKQVYINEYEVTDIGGNLHRFLKENVDIEYHDPSGRTTYEVFAVDPRNDTDRGPGRQVVIESPPDSMPDDELSKARGAVELIRDLRDLDGDKQAAKDALLGEAQKKAAASGDMTQLMMLMMMQNMQQPRNEVDIAGRVLEHMRSSGKHDAFPMMPPPPLPPPMIMQQPTDDPMRAVMAKLVEHSVTKTEKSTVDFAKDLAVIKELFAQPAKADDTEMKLILKALIEKVSQPQQSGLDAIVAQFGKIKEVVTTLAPQVNAGGLIGALQSIITPQLGSALGNVIAAGLQKSQAFTGPPPPAQPAAKPGPSPQVQAAVVAFRSAADEPGQIVTAYQLFSALYEDPANKTSMEPSLLALMQGDVEPARKTSMELISGVRPDLAKQPFSDKVVAHLIKAAGGTAPEWLEKGWGSPQAPSAAVVEVPVAQPLTPVAPVEDPRQGAKLAQEPEVVVVEAPKEPKQGEALRDVEDKSNGVKQGEALREQPAPVTAAA